MSDSSVTVESVYSDRRAVRIGVYVMLLLSAIASFLLHDTLLAAAKDGALPKWSPLVPGILFTLFVGVYTVDRWLLVRRHNYPLGRAVFQMAFAVVFLTLLWRQPSPDSHSAEGEVQLEYPRDLLQHQDPHVRAAGCELLGLRGMVDAKTMVAEIAENDTHGFVRNTCAASLKSLGAPPPQKPPQ